MTNPTIQRQWTHDAVLGQPCVLRAWVRPHRVVVVVTFTPGVDLVLKCDFETLLNTLVAEFTDDRLVTVVVHALDEIPVLDVPVREMFAQIDPSGDRPQLRGVPIPLLVADLGEQVLFDAIRQQTH